MPQYKLYYFDIKGLAEPIRVLFAYGGIEYEDVRVARDDWPALKPTMPMGQMPVLEVDGKRVYQSLAISRYIAKQVGLAGADDWESLLIDIAVDNVNDFRVKMAAPLYEKDEDAKAKKSETVKTEVLPFFLDKLEAIAAENSGHLALGKLTWADIYFVSLLDFFKFIAGSDILSDRPNLQKVANNVSEIASIKAWFEKRPKSDY